MSVIQLTIGMENVEMASAKVHAFVVVNGEELHITKPQAVTVGVRRVGPTTQIDAVPGMRREVCGGWTSCNYEVPPGVLLKLFATRKTGFGQIPETHSVWCVVDESAALVEVRISTSGAARCAVPYVNAVGRFRWLTLPEAEALLPRPVPIMFRSQFYSLSHPDALIRIHRTISVGVRPGQRSITPARSNVVPRELQGESLVEALARQGALGALSTTLGLPASQVAGQVANQSLAPLVSGGQIHLLNATISGSASLPPAPPPPVVPAPPVVVTQEVVTAVVRRRRLL